MMHATNSDMIPVREINPAHYLKEAEARRKRLLGSDRKPTLESAIVMKERDEVIEQLAKAKARISELEKYAADMEALASDYSRTLMHYIQQNESVDEALGVKANGRPVIKIIRETLRAHPNITFDDVVGPQRTRAIVAARFACIWAVKKERKDLSYPQMGRIFRRDHSSIISAVRQMPDDLMAA